LDVYFHCSSNGSKEQELGFKVEIHVTFRMHAKGKKFSGEKKGKKHRGRRVTQIKALITPEDTCFRTEVISQKKGLLR